MSELKIFAQRLKEARIKLGLSQAELSRRTGISAATISSYEVTDNPKKPTMEKTVLLARALNVSLDWLCGISDELKKNITDITSEVFFRSLATVLLETSSKYDSSNNTLAINNPVIASFVKQIRDLISVYYSGILNDDYFLLLVDKVIEDTVKNYVMLGNCILNNDEYNDATNLLENIFQDDIVAAGLVHFKVHSYQDCTTRDVDVMINESIDKMFSGSSNHNNEG